MQEDTEKPRVRRRSSSRSVRVACFCGASASASGWLALRTAAAPLLSRSFYFVGQARDTCPPPPALRSRRFEVGGFEQKHGV